MPKDRWRPIFVGIKGNVVALDSASGTELWRRPLKGAEFVNLHRDGERLYATTKGEIFCLDPASGTIVWHNPLKGLGYGLATMLSEAAPQTQQSGYVSVAEEKRRRDAA